MRPETIQSGKATILCDADAAPGLTLDHFEPGWWESQRAVIGRATGRAQVYFVQAQTGVWALRHYQRGGWMARLTEDLYWWSGLENTRPWREWKLTAALHQQGLPVPQPIAARVSRSGLFYRGDLITRRIESAQTLADLLAAQPLSPDGWRRLGLMLRQFHDAGVQHDDINARNVLVNPSGAFYLIDFDKAAVVNPGAWRDQNLARFRRSLEKFARLSPRFHFVEGDWTALLDGYGNRKGVGGVI